MRQILIDFARAQDTGKRGNRAPHVDLSVIRNLPGAPAIPVDFIDLQAQVVELRYFGGLENAGIAAVLGISGPTVVRDWRVARAWLYAKLRVPR
jgi:RNA polymerase sigma-70 factor (ECF subfamily)